MSDAAVAFQKGIEAGSEGAAIGGAADLAVGATVLAAIATGQWEIAGAIVGGAGTIAEYAVPVAAAVAFVVGFFISLCKPDPPTPQEALEAYFGHLHSVERARELVARLDSPAYAAQRLAAESSGKWLAGLRATAAENTFFDPLKLVQSPANRQAFQALLALKGMALSDDQILAEAKKRFDANSPKLDEAYLKEPANLKALSTSFRRGQVLRPSHGRTRVLGRGPGNVLQTGPSTGALLLAGGGALALLGFGGWLLSRPRTSAPSPAPDDQPPSPR